MGLDKAYHFIAGFSIYIIIDNGSAYLNVNLSPVIMMLIVLCVGIAKEIIDKYTSGDVEFADVLATISGGLAGLYFSL